MNIYSTISIIAAITYLLVAHFVYSRSKGNPVNRSFSIMLLCLSIWLIDVAGIIGAPSPRFAEIWGKIFRIGLLFIPPTFLHFCYLFTHPMGIEGRARKILAGAYITSCFFAVMNWTPYFTAGVKAYPWGYHVQSGTFYPLFFLQFLLCIILSLFYLIRGYIGADSYQRQRLRYFFLALVVSSILGSLNFLPVFGVEFSPFGSIVTTAGLFIAAYSIVQYRLMDVSVFMAKGLGYILTFAILGVPFFFVILLLEEFFFHRMDIAFVLILICFGIASILLFNLIKGRVDRAMRQIIVKDKYDYHQVLDEFSRRLVTIVDLNRLLNMLADTIEKSMGVQKISIFLQETEKQIFRPHLIRGSEDGNSLKISEAGVQYLHEQKEAILRIELEGSAKEAVTNELLEIMKKYGAEVCLPMVYMNRLIGFINLGAKAGKELYFPEDLSLLYPLANQVAIAIENSNLYENLKKSQSIMRRADRLASLGTLIASLAHEIRNPLVSIKTFTQLLPERIEDEEFRNYFLKVASGEIDRLTGLINELLGFARPSEPRLEGEDVNALIDKMEVLVATEARKKNVTLNKNYARDLPQIKADAEQLKQVLLNILLNAIQAIKGEGKIWIETRQVQVPIEDRVESFTQIEVRDTGMGIPKENLERIFDPFFSTRLEGSGLGLAISHQIIHDHGGFISVESEVGKGTSFKVHLPLKPGGKGADPR